MRFLVIVFPLLLSACASAGTPFEWDNVRNVRIGMTDSELVATMGGKPSAVSALAGGKQVWVWTYVRSHATEKIRSTSFVL
jgi:hypothetical protein